MVVCRGTTQGAACAIKAAHAVEVMVFSKGILQAKLRRPELARIEAPPIADRNLIDRLNLALEVSVANDSDIGIIKVTAVPIALVAVGKVLLVIILQAVIPVELQCFAWVID